MDEQAAVEGLEAVPQQVIVDAAVDDQRLVLGGHGDVVFDARDLPEIFEPGEVQRIYINFPDPWKKSRQKKRRLTWGAFLAIYAQLLPVGGEIWFKSDNDPLFEWSLEQFRSQGWELRELTRDLHADGPVGVMTDYEAKFFAEGVTINRVVAVKTECTKCDFSLGTSTD